MKKKTKKDPKIKGKVVDEKKNDVEIIGEKESDLEIVDEKENSVEGKEESLLTDLAESKDKYLRLYSEFDNYRRRTSKERLDLILTAGEKIITQLLPVLDDFERARKLTGEKNAPMPEGFDIITQKFENILLSEGVKVMETSEGTEFDPDLHEAITQIPAPKKSLKGKIVETVEKGYYLKEKVIRFAKVIMGN